MMKRWIAVVAAGCTVFGSALAKPVAWKNGVDGLFDWKTLDCEGCNGNGWGPRASLLDISVRPGQQPNRERGIYRTYCCNMGFSGAPTIVGLRGNTFDSPETLMQVAVPQVDVITLPCVGSLAVVEPIDYGEALSEDTIWGDVMYQRTMDYYRRSCGNAYRFEGPYIGVRLKIDGQWHYGWIDWRLRAVPATTPSRVFPAAWALESEPNTPIRTPACDADHDLNGTLDLFDYLGFAEDFVAGSIGADFDRSGRVDFFDYLEFIAEYTRGCGR
jgi:hypothetical protein